jgi:hypothetical protein
MAIAKFRFQLRTGLILVAGIAVICAVFGEHFRRQRLLKNATAALQSEGVMVMGDMYGVVLTNRNDVGNLLARLDDVLNRCGGARIATLHGSDVNDEGLILLRGWSRLRNIDLGRTQITDRGIAVLVELPRLEEVRLSGTHVTDEGLELLCAAPSLKFLDVTRTDVTRVGVEKARREHPQIEIESSFDEAASAHSRDSVSDQCRQ